MYKNCSFKLVIITVAVLLFASCSKIPDHARYIPKDAILVGGINLKSLGKKIAWEVLTGSKIFKQMQDHVPEKGNPDALSGLDKSGIDVFNTFYVYIKSDKRFAGGNSITALIPLSDDGKWEDFVKKAFPKSEIKSHNGRKETGFGSMYIGWTKNLLIVINAMGSADQYISMIQNNNIGNALSPEEMAELSAEMEKAFSVTQVNSLLENKKFDSLEKSGHDVSLWLNYDAIMDQFGSENIAQMTGGVSPSNILWKEAAMAMGFDFDKGKILGDIQYYLPDKLKSVGIEFGSANADKEMLDRMPAKDMDLLIATHCSPKAVKAMMDTSGLTGMANSTLSGQDLDIDAILDAFTGDFAFNMNNFNLSNHNENFKAALNMNFVLKINKKENFEKLYQMGLTLLEGSNTGMKKLSENSFMVPLQDDGKDTIFFMKDNQYAMVSNKLNNINGFFKGDFMKGNDGLASYEKITAHPWTMFFDLQQFTKNIDQSVISNPEDSVRLAESRKLLKSITFNGGEFRNNAINYKIEISFLNEDANSLLSILDYSIKMQDAEKKMNNNPNF